MTPPKHDSSLLHRGLPPVFLNHVVVTLDAAAYRDFQSAFLRRFAVTEQRTTTTNRGAHTGFYLYGTYTYLEFVLASEKQPAGSSGVAFEVDRTGRLQALADAAAPHLIVEEKPVTRDYEGEPVPWFYLGGRAGFSTDFAVWLMEYHPQFLARWHPRLAGQGVSRETELGVWLGYDERSVEGETLLKGPGLEIRLSHTADARGIRELTLHTEGKSGDGPEGGLEYRFGLTTLCFHGDVATWSFWPAPDQV